MNLFRLIKKNGFLYLAEQVFNRVVPSSVLRFSVMNIYDVDREKLRRVERNDSILCQVATDDPTLVSTLREVTHMGMSAEKMIGHTGYLASIRDTNNEESPTVAGGVWAGIGEYLEEDFGFQLKLTDTQAWIYCALVNKSARGSGVYTNAFCYAVDDLVNRGLDDVLLSVTIWNKKSRRAHHQLVSRRIGRITALRIFSFAFVFTSGDLAKTKTFAANIDADPIAIRLKPASQ